MLSKQLAVVVSSCCLHLAQPMMASDFFSVTPKALEASQRADDAKIPNKFLGG